MGQGPHRKRAGSSTWEREELRGLEVRERQTPLLQPQMSPRTRHHAGHTAPHPRWAGERGNPCGTAREAPQERGRAETGTWGRESGKGSRGQAKPAALPGRPRAHPHALDHGDILILVRLEGDAPGAAAAAHLGPRTHGRPQGDSASALPARPAVTPLPIGRPRAFSRRTPLPIG